LNIIFEVNKSMATDSHWVKLKMRSKKVGSALFARLVGTTFSFFINP